MLSLPDLSAYGGYDYEEIAHAALLPPAASDPSLERVLFIARRDYYAGICHSRPAEGWLWRADRPWALRRITNTASPDNMSGDPFCAGHTFTSDGRFLVVGGLDMENDYCSHTCPKGDTGTGHRWTYMLNTDVQPPTWDTSWMTSLNDATAMGRARWYPTAISLHDDTIFIGGHGPFSEPGRECCPKFYENGGAGAYQVHYERTYELLNVSGTPGFGPVSTSWIDKGHCNAQIEDDVVPLGAYPKLHLLSNKYMIQTNTRQGLVFMDRDPLTIACGDGRWQREGGGSQDLRRGGSSVHVVYLTGQENEPRDVLYVLGGTAGEDSEVWDSGEIPHDSVKRLDVQSWSTAEWIAAATLNTGRFNHNTVILLDGSFLVNGGWTGDPKPANCENPVPLPLFTERYRPPELFGITPGSGQDVWKEMTMAREPTHRRYHSVALLLPDGRVLSGGGVEFSLNGCECTEEEIEECECDCDCAAVWSLSAHTVNIYSPSYMFHSRPEITASPSVIEYIDEQESFEVTFTLSSETSEFSRIGLIRNASVTHAWDSNQRYVELDAEIVSQNGLEVTLEVTSPEDGFVAPPGYYLMSVVEFNPLLPPPAQNPFGAEERKWLPSPGVWVRIDS